MSELKEGANAPAINLETDTGAQFNLADQKGKNVVVFFYPKADTPGCTTEACEFRDAEEGLSAQNTVVVGVSPDPAKAQTKFKQKFNLNFPLLCDVDHKVAEDYGVWVEKSMYGKKYMGIDRTTFIIDPDGKIARIFRKVKPAGHANEVLQALGQLA